jgi:hypothetical protein
MVACCCKYAETGLTKSGNYAATVLLLCMLLKLLLPAGETLVKHVETCLQFDATQMHV